MSGFELGDSFTQCLNLFHQFLVFFLRLLKLLIAQDGFLLQSGDCLLPFLQLFAVGRHRSRVLRCAERGAR